MCIAQPSSHVTMESICRYEDAQKISATVDSHFYIRDQRRIGVPLFFFFVYIGYIEFQLPQSLILGDVTNVAVLKDTKYRELL